MFESDKRRIVAQSIDTWVPDALQEKCWDMIDNLAKKEYFDSLNQFQLFDFKFEKKDSRNWLIITHTPWRDHFKYEIKMEVPEKMSLLNFPILALAVSDEGDYQFMFSGDDEYQSQTGKTSPYKYYYFSKKEKREVTEGMPLELQKICWELIDEKIDEKKYDIKELQCFELEKDYANHKLIINHYQAFYSDDNTSFNYTYETDLTEDLETFDALTVYAADIMDAQGFMIDTHNDFID